MQPAENLRALREVVAIFNRLAIPYALSGSMASSVFGVPRFTQDADIAVEPFPGQERLLVESLDLRYYYISESAVVRANRAASSFNIIHTGIGFKIDVFVRKERAFDRSAMGRRISLELPDDPQHPLMLISAEDLVLFKLEWYHLGGEASDRQWADILGVLRTQADRMDRVYLDRWAAELGVGELLLRALEKAAG